MFSDHAFTDFIICAALLIVFLINSAFIVVFTARPIADYFVSLFNKNRLS